MAKIFALLSSLFIFTADLKAQFFNRLKNESVQDFAERVKPKNSTIVHDALENTAWGNRKVILVFYSSTYIDTSTTYKNERQYVKGYLFIPVAENKYQQVFIDKLEDDNVETNIATVFFANADKDSARELIIISTCSHNLRYLYEGTEYSTHVYDNIDLNNIPGSMQLLPKISAALSGGLEGFTEGNGKSKSGFKTSNDVKKALKKMGF
jgi:hypothetical protein